MAKQKKTYTKAEKKSYRNGIFTGLRKCGCLGKKKGNK